MGKGFVLGLLVATGAALLFLRSRQEIPEQPQIEVTPYPGVPSVISPEPISIEVTPIEYEEEWRRL